MAIENAFAKQKWNLGTFAFLLPYILIHKKFIASLQPTIYSDA